MTDLYADASVFMMAANGVDTPSYRQFTGPNRDMEVLMTVRQECGMEVAIDPDGRSGQQWDAWEAMFSPAEVSGPRAGLPKRLFDRATGAIDRSVVEHWAKFDITNMVVENWPRFGPVVVNKVRLACGENDSFYLNRAVDEFRQVVEKHRVNEEMLGVPGDGPGYVLMVPRADHGTIHGKIFQRWNTEMRAHLQSHGLQDGP